MSSPTRPGVVTLTLGNQSGVTIVDMANPAREYSAPGEATPTVPRVKRKYTRRHFDKQRHEAHEDKQEEQDV